LGKPPFSATALRSLLTTEFPTFLPPYDTVLFPDIEELVPAFSQAGQSTPVSCFRLLRSDCLRYGNIPPRATMYWDACKLAGCNTPFRRTLENHSASGHGAAQTPSYPGRVDSKAPSVASPHRCPGVTFPPAFFAYPFLRQRPSAVASFCTWSLC